MRETYPPGALLKSIAGHRRRESSLFTVRTSRSIIFVRLDDAHGSVSMFPTLYALAHDDDDDVDHVDDDHDD